MTANKSAVKSSMNDANERDPFNNNSYGTLVDHGYKTVSLPVLDVTDFNERVIRAYEEGVGSIDDIDNAMKLGCGYPMGPFTLLDFVGLDTTYYITHVMYDEFKERRFASPPLLKRLVMAGWYGRKTGKGFYDYSDPANPKPNKL